MNDPPDIETSISYGYFHRAANRYSIIYGAAGLLIFSPSHIIFWMWTSVGAIWLQAKGQCSSNLDNNCKGKKYRGDEYIGYSQLVIEWMNNSRDERSISLLGHLQHARYLEYFSVIHFHHTLWDFNQDADKFSKNACAKDTRSFLLMFS